MRRLDNQTQGSVNDSRRQIVYMLSEFYLNNQLQPFVMSCVSVSVVVLFFVSWAPFHLQRLSYVYLQNYEMFRTINQILFYFSGCFYYLSSTLNPLLYNVMSIKYRQAFRATITCSQNPEDQLPVLRFTTLNTSTTNLITASYIHLRDLIDSRRNSRQSFGPSIDSNFLSTKNGVKGTY